MLARPLRIFICAAEESGDKLGAPILRSLLERYPHAKVMGVGGRALQKAGLKETLFPMEELSLMGVLEILPKVPHMIKRIRQTVNAIEEFQPDILITIDGPEFNFRIHKKIRDKNLHGIKQLHCVAPTVWAWREGRAEKISRFLNGLLCLFPFEPGYFETLGLRAEYMGHPYSEKKSGLPAKSKLKKEWGVSAKEKTIGVFFGSRRQEIRHHAKIFCEALRLFLNEQGENYKIIIPSFPKFEEDIREALEEFKLTDRAMLIIDEEDRQQALGGLDMAIAVSGTIGLELAMASVPHCIGYKTSNFTYQIVKRLIKVKYAHLGNIILNEKAVPELLQHDCTPEKLSEALKAIDEGEKDEQKKAFKKLNVLMDTKKPPSEIAADFIEECLAEDA